MKHEIKDESTMGFHDVVLARRSIRGYRKTAVAAEKLEQVMEAVRLAPSACNRQPVKFLLAKSPEMRARICEAYDQPWMADAPIIVVCLGNREQGWRRLDGTSAHVIDASIAMQQLVLAATAEGLGTCWVCAFDPKALADKLGLADEWEVIALTPLGYRAADPKPVGRKPLAELFEVI